jgi:hypothetical protein
MHIGHKYPKLNIEGKQWLRNRLGKAITQRRQFLRYTREHRQKLGKEPMGYRQPVIKASQATTEFHPTQVDDTRASQTASTKSTRITSTLAPTSASTLLLVDGPIAESDIPDDHSQTSYTLSLGENDQEGRPQLPSLHDVSRGQASFECPFCWTMQSIRKESTWRKHAFSDLRPYACTFGGCDVKLFADRRDWFDHELKQHRLQWLCHFCGRQDFAAGDVFRDHLRNDHVHVVTEGQLNALVEACRRPLEAFSPAECPFCDSWEATLCSRNTSVQNRDAVIVTPAQFRHHIGSHMQDLALFAIPRGYLEEDEADLDSTASVRAAGGGTDSASKDSGTEQNLNLIKLPVATGASFNSHNEEHNARCLPNTRTELLDQITQWANDDSGKPIF